MTELGIIKFDVTEEALVALTEKHKGYEITDYKSYKVVVEAIAEVRGFRGQVEKHRKELKKDALEYGKKVDGTAKTITERLWQIEKPLKHIKGIEDDKKAAEKAEKERLEAVRIAEIQLKITSINNMVTGLPSLNAGQLNALYDELAAIEITQGEFQEFADHADQVQVDAIEAVSRAYKERVKLDQETATRKAEGERLAKEKEAQRVEAERLEAVKKEQERKDREFLAEKTAAAKKLAAEKAKFEAEKQAEFDRKKEELKAKIDTENIAKAFAGQEEGEKVEAERQEALKPDKQKLLEMADMLDGLILPNIEDEDAEVIRCRTRADLNLICENVRREVKEL